MSEQKPSLPKDDDDELDHIEHERVRTQAVVANDNQVAWPLVPFPDGWNGCS